MPELITPAEMAAILAGAINAHYGVPIADIDENDSCSLVVAAPATGQLFRMTVTDALASAASPARMP